ncbi:PilW family protein [Dyella koreensis]|uniref:PilW family protein n=1 Tax=Dyella koreensis TaxID=311235 RepID=A0ABW8K7Y3_9GAMM
MPRLFHPRVLVLRDRFRGLSLVELMVGLLISLICLLAIMSAFAAFEGRKRTTTSGSDAQQNGLYALFELERQVRTAGAGLTQGYNYGVWGCAMSAYAERTQQLPRASALPAPFATWPHTAAAPVTMRALPVLIASGGTDSKGQVASDTLALVAGNPATTVFKASVVGAPDSATVDVDNAFGSSDGDYVLATTTAGDCALAKIAIASVATNRWVLSPADSPPAGLIGASQAFNLGPQPVISLYGVDPATSSLVTYDALGRRGTKSWTVADGIVQVKALYGVDTDGDNVVDTWVTPTGAWSITALTTDQAAAARAFAQIKAIRVAVVAQSLLPERASDYVGAPSLKLFADLDASLQYTISTQPQYRYKVYDTTIPIRNALITQHF